MRYLLLVAVVLFSAGPALAHDEHSARPDSSMTSAFEATLETARAAIRRHGVTDSAMVEIQAALAKLAAMPSLRDNAHLQQIHGSSGSNAALLAGSGHDSLSLYLARFQPGHATPVHDHQTWGVLYVLEGRDHYIHWDVDYTTGDRSRADVRMATGAILGPGSSVYWFPPPHDLHSQQAIGGTVWELLISGRNFLSPEVLEQRHYFDRSTGTVTPMPRK